MKLSKHAFVRLWDVHAWAGVVAALVLHVIFFAGGFALFYQDLTAWQEPSPARAAARAPLLPLQQVMTSALRARGQEFKATPKEMYLALSEHHPYVELGWSTPGVPERTELRVDRRTGSLVPETSHLSRILFWLHFLYHPKVAWGMNVAGLFGVALLLALVSGVFIHLKDIVRQFHQFRPERTVRVLWSDLHKVLGVMGLPFQVMFAFTGAVICLGGLLLTAFTGPVFAGDEKAAGAAMWGPEGEAKASAEASAALDLDELLARAAARFPGFAPTYLAFEHRGEAKATVKAWGESPRALFRRGEITLRASDGAVLTETVNRSATPGTAVYRWITGLHYALFGGLATKILYALLAVATSLTLLSGNWIWLVRRQARAASAGNQILARLTLGMGGGVVLATAALFLANRLAPGGARMAAESGAFFGVWGLTTLAALFRPASVGSWVTLLRVAGVGFAAVPVLSLFGDSHLFNVAERGRTEVLGVECGLLLLASTLLLTATLLNHRWAAPSPT